MPKFNRINYYYYNGLSKACIYIYKSFIFITESMLILKLVFAITRCVNKHYATHWAITYYLSLAI